MNARQIFVVVAFAFGIFSAGAAQALIEVKGGYSQFAVNPSALNSAFAAAPAITQLQALSIDVIGNVPLMPVGLGVRYEGLKRNEGAGTNGSEVDWKRTSILVNKRFIDTLVYLGPIITISVASDFKYRSTIAGVATDYKTDSQLTATVGVEAGLKLLIFRIGAEAGYLYAPMGELKTAAGTPVLDSSGQKLKFDMSGTYVRILAGFGF